MPLQIGSLYYRRAVSASLIELLLFCSGMLKEPCKLPLKGSEKYIKEFR